MTEHKLVLLSHNLILMLSTFSDLYYEICGWILVTWSFMASSSTIILSTLLKECIIKQLQDKLEFVWSELIKHVLLLTSVSYTKLVFLLLFWEDLPDKRKCLHFSWLWPTVAFKGKGLLKIAFLIWYVSTQLWKSIWDITLNGIIRFCPNSK